MMAYLLTTPRITGATRNKYVFACFVGSKLPPLKKIVHKWRQDFGNILSQAYISLLKKSSLLLDVIYGEPYFNELYNV